MVLCSIVVAVALGIAVRDIDAIRLSWRSLVFADSKVVGVVAACIVEMDVMRCPVVVAVVTGVLYPTVVVVMVHCPIVVVVMVLYPIVVVVMVLCPMVVAVVTGVLYPIVVALVRSVSVRGIDAVLFAGGSVVAALYA